MRSRDFVFWEVDVQRDFMLPGGALYVPGAEKIVPNIRRLTDAARRDEVLLVSSGDFHSPTIPSSASSLRTASRARWARSCCPRRWRRRPSGLKICRARDCRTILSVPAGLLEKQTLDVFQSLHADELVKRLGDRAEFVVFGVVTEYCVDFAVRGLVQRKRRVAVVQDAIETLSSEAGQKCLRGFPRLGARLVTTSEVLQELAESHR